MADRYGPFSSLIFERPEPGILRIVMRNPGKLNAAGHDMHHDLAYVWPVIDRDPEVRVALIQGADGVFSAGGDLDLVRDIAADFETRIRVHREARDLVYNV